MNLDNDQHDALKEIINIGVGRAACMLGDLVEKRIELHVPSVTICELEELDEVLGQRGALLDTAIYQEFDGSVAGRSILAFPRDSSLKLGQLLSGLYDEPFDVDTDLSGMLVEVGNIVLNGVLGSLGNMFESSLQYSVPELALNSNLKTLATAADAVRGQTQAVILTDAEFNVATEQICGSLVLIFSVHEVELALDRLLQSA